MFRPCIDLHEGKVKQIVGGSLSERPGELRTNFVSERSAAWYAELYRRDGLKGRSRGKAGRQRRHAGDCGKREGSDHGLVHPAIHLATVTPFCGALRLFSSQMYSDIRRSGRHA